MSASKVKSETEDVPPAEDAPAEDAPAEDAPAEDAPAEDAPAEDAPAEDASAEEAPEGSAEDVASAPKETPVLQASPDVWRNGFVWGTGRRKSAVSRVRIKPGSGLIEVNGKKYEDFFPTKQAQLLVLAPLDVTETRNKYDVFVNVDGGGITGQAGATALGLGRALKDAEPALESALRDGGLLTRDSRMKERKKYGLRKARRAFQFSKR